MQNNRNKGGRPPHQPTDQTRMQVRLCAAFGNTMDQIAQIIGIAPNTLALHYRAELDHGAAYASHKVKTNLYRLATRNDFKAVKAIELWLRLIEHASEYAPAPIGKKVAAQLAAEEAPSEDSSWAGLLN
jgi:hypothetical protein